MLKYIKWICLFISIIGIVLLGIKFINLNDKESLNNKKFNINKIYNTAWYKTGIAYYENNKLIDENFNIKDLDYIIFTSKNITYYNSNINEINTYDYIFKNKSIVINFDSNLIVKGTYNIEIENEKLKLTNCSNKYCFVYYFESAKG